MMKSITTLSLALCVVLTFSSPNANAVSLLATDGSISMNTTTPAPFDDVFVNLAGPDFTLRNNFLQDSWRFTGTPNPGFHHPAPGTLTDFSGTVALQSPSRLVFQGTEYRALGTLTVATALVPASHSVLTPFTLSGTLEGQRLGVVGPPETAVRATIAGQGLMSAQLFNFDNIEGAPLHLRSVVYNILPAAVTPEPTVPAAPAPSQDTGSGAASTAQRNIANRWNKLTQVPHRPGIQHVIMSPPAPLILSQLPAGIEVLGELPNGNVVLEICRNGGYLCPGFTAEVTPGNMRLDAGAGNAGVFNVAGIGTMGPTVVNPEPGTLALLGTGAAWLLGRRRRGLNRHP